ncbi:MAG: sigma-70 family RNA polymerase sigma factor [Candidatus Poribacteria bacterium]|nr:sigma-70 family RNA polymerase sigma factor [Candidatus Poribacteria bacterium]
MKNNDAELIQRVLEGDDNAFATLVRKYQKQVHALAWRKIGDFHIAEEITQDTFLKAYKKLATLKRPQRFVSWLYVIAANRCSSWLRKKQLKTEPLEQLEEIDNEQSQTAAYSRYVTEENERTTAEAQRDVVKKLLAKLQESERTVITLHYFGEMSCPEIGAFLGVSANTIKSRLRRAQQRLKKEEPIIREALENFQITPNLTENIMREVSRIKPIAPTSGKPFLPWAISASTIAVVLLMLGIGSYQYAIHFQQPYNFNATSEMKIDIIEAPLVLKLAVKTDARTQLRNPEVSSKHNKTREQQSDDVSALVAEAQTDEISKDYSQWALPKEAKARLGKGGINALQFSPDGTKLAVGSNIGIWLYDAQTGKEISMFPGVCRFLAFSPDGRFIASGGRPGLQVWEIATGQKMSHIEKLPSAAALRFSKDSKTVVSLGNWRETIVSLDVETGEGNVKKINETVKRTSSPQSYALTRDKFAFGRQDGEIELGNIMTGKKSATLSGHTGGIQGQLPFKANEKGPPEENQEWLLEVNEVPPEENQVRFIDGMPNSVLALAFSPDGTKLASGSKDKTVRLWDTFTNDELVTLRKHTGRINALVFSPDGKMLASGSADKTVQLWDTATGAHLATFDEHIKGIAALTFSPDGRTLASGSIDGAIHFWNTTTRTLLPIRFTAHTEWVKAVSFFEDSSTFASVDFNGVITLWDLKTSQKTGVQTIVPPDFLLTSAFSPDGTKLISSGAESATFLNGGYGRVVTTREPDHLLRLTDVTTGRELTTLTKLVGGGIHQEGTMTFSPDGKTVASYGFGGICVWHLETSDVITIALLEQNNDDAMVHQHIMAGMLNEITVLMFSPDGKKLVGGTTGGKVQMWDPETGVELAPFLAGQEVDDKEGPNNFTVRFEDQITALAFSSKGTLIAVGSQQTIRLLGSSKQPRLKDAPRGTESLAFSPDDTVLIAGLIDGRIELFDMTTGEKITTLNGHTLMVEALAFSPDGNTLVSTGQDGTILVWDWDKIIENLPAKDK